MGARQNVREKRGILLFSLTFSPSPPPIWPAMQRAADQRLMRLSLWSLTVGCKTFGLRQVYFVFV